MKYTHTFSLYNSSIYMAGDRHDISPAMRKCSKNPMRVWLWSDLNPTVVTFAFTTSGWSSVVNRWQNLWVDDKLCWLAILTPVSQTSNLTHSKSEAWNQQWTPRQQCLSNHDRYQITTLHFCCACLALPCILTFKLRPIADSLIFKFTSVLILSQSNWFNSVQHSLSVHFSNLHSSVYNSVSVTTFPNKLVQI